MAGKEKSLALAVESLKARNAYLEKERIELQQKVQKLEKDGNAREMIIKALETENARLRKDVKDLRDHVGQLTYELGQVKRRESLSYRPKDSPLPLIPSEDTGRTRATHLPAMDEEDSGSGYARIGNVERTQEASDSDGETGPPTAARKRTLTMDDVHIQLDPSRDAENLTSTRNRAATVANGPDIFQSWKRGRGNVKTSLTIDSLQPMMAGTRKTSKNVRQHGLLYPIAPDMEEKIQRKIKEELGRKYGGLERATAAALVIQRWYKATNVKRHWTMLKGMAVHEPKKLRQRTMSMRQSTRYRRTTMASKVTSESTMKKQTSILQEFPALQDRVEKCSTPRQVRRHKHSTTALNGHSSQVDRSQDQEEQVSVEFPEEPRQQHWRKPTMKKMIVQSSFSEERLPREGESLSPGGDSGISTISPTPGEEGLSVITQSRLSKISEFRVVEGQQYLKGERESATTMRRKINIGINYFNRKPWKGLIYLVQRRVLQDSPAKVASFFMSRLDLSREKIGEFLGDIQSDFSNSVLDEMVGLMNFQKKTVDEALRVFQAHFLMPGEAQKIEKIVEVFAHGYYEANRGSDDDIFESSDAIFILSYAIMMLNTDLHNPNVRRHLTRGEWLGMNRGINGGGDFPAEFLIGIYDRILRSPFMPARDHTHDVDAIEKSVIGCPPIVLTHRRILFKCKVAELEKDGHKSRPRFLFVFNDVLLVTKPRNRDYQFKSLIPLLGANIIKFETISTANKYGVDIRCNVSSSNHFMCSCENEVSRAKLVKHLEDAVAELTEMERERILAGEQSALNSVRLSPSNLSAMEAPEFSTSEKSDYEQEMSGMVRSGSVPDGIFVLSDSSSPLTPRKEPGSMKTISSIETSEVEDSTSEAEDRDEVGKRPHSISVGGSQSTSVSDESRLSVSLTVSLEQPHQDKAKSLDRRRKQKAVHSPSPTPSSPGKFHLKFWKKKGATSPTRMANGHN